MPTNAQNPMSMFPTNALNGFNQSTDDYTSPYAGQPTWSGTVPIVPQFNNIYNPSMSLGNQMQGMLSGVQYNQQPLQELAANAESTSASPWAQLQSQLAKQQTGQAASQAANQTAGSTAQAEGNLAMTGGLSSGATERAQTAGQQAGIGAEQSVANQGNQTQAQIGLQDAANKQQELMALPGMETQAYQANLEPIQMQGQAEAQDVAHNMANEQALNQFNMTAYGNQAGMFGAGQTADSQLETAKATSGLFGGGGFLGLGSWLCTERNKIKSLTHSDKVNLSRLLRYAKVEDRAFTRWYLRQGQVLVSRILAQDPLWADKINVVFVNHVLSLLHGFKMDEAFQYYRKHVYALCAKYWPGCPDEIIMNHPERREWAS